MIDIVVIVSPGLTQLEPFQPFLRTGMESAVTRVRSAADANITPSGKPHRRAGAGYGPLKGSLTTRVASTNTPGVIGAVGTPVFYGRFLEYGTRAHPIAATTRRALVFMPRGGAAGPGGVVIRRSAQHPGQRARFWMRTAATSETPAVVQGFEEQARRWAAAVNREL